MWVQSLGWEDPLEEGIRTEATQHACTCSLKASQVVLVVKNLPANAGDVGLFPGWGRSPGGGHGNPVQYSCLETSMDRGAWQATVHGVQRVRKAQT